MEKKDQELPEPDRKAKRRSTSLRGLPFDNINPGEVHPIPRRLKAPFENPEPEKLSDKIEERHQIPKAKQLGPYVLKGVLGQGGMGTVFRGYDASLDRTVAVKVLGREIADDEAFARRFLSEARALAQISSENVVQIYFVGSEGDLHFYAMEYVEGTSLNEEVEEHGPLSQRDAVVCALQAAQGLAAAAAKNIVHRDVKPDNLIRIKGGLVKVADFGLAKVLTSDQNLTQTGMVIGSPYYMSPEQSLIGEVDLRSDIYSLGCTLFFLLMGRPPFQGASALDTTIMHKTHDLPEIRNVPIQLKGAVNQMMAKQPKDRFQDYQSLIASLELMKQLELLSDDRPHGSAAPNRLG